MATEDLKSLATSTTADYYDLLSLEPHQTSDQESIRRAYRKTALKYHPDKVGASNHAALEKFHLLQIAYDVLSTPELKDLYDNARRAREQVKERDHLLSARRREMKDDLERREREGAQAGKRKWEGDDEMAQEMAKMREDTKRRRVEIEERRRREMEELLREEEGGAASTVADLSTEAGDGVTEMERSVKVRFGVDDMVENELREVFGRFGEVEDVVVRSKPPKDSTTKKKKKRSPHTALLVYKSVVGAHAAVSDYPKLATTEPETFSRFDSVEWAAGREPDFIPKPKAPVLEDTNMATNSPPRPRATAYDGGEAKTKVPKFSFKPTKGAGGGATLDEVTMIRLKNAEKRRQEAKIRKEEEAADLEEADGVAE
ncbi:hypothetical protein LTR09_000429 [Extremus antarcticus]|uniref:J domain-containing protein n=1 Tax=Extremus antarcticus TaxID=702011 RepID=A0AAJ0GJM5_9PEZI|nr:hypothetical protein LTR09_000429 [Extremus antarcticus]